MLSIAALIGLGSAAAAAAEPAKPKPPLHPLMFDTPEADAILAVMAVVPPSSPWRQDISKLPVHPDSAAIVAHIGADKHLACNRDMAFVIVPPNQAKVAVKLVDYPDESDPGPYPVPDNAPIEEWPLNGVALDKIQREGSGDRHLIVFDPWDGKLFEFWQARRTDAGWQASNEATFDLASGKLRPDGWTSSDAAGLPILPAVARYDECERGLVEHALRFTVRTSRKAHISPATHHAGKSNDPSFPAMGQRLRLKATVDISAYPKHAHAIAQALKTYGMIVADNGGDWRLSISPDKRIGDLAALGKISGADFEVVLTEGGKK